MLSTINLKISSASNIAKGIKSNIYIKLIISIAKVRLLLPENKYRFGQNAIKG